MKDYNDILISVIVPVFNKSRTLRRCIRSVQMQSHANIEILVVDDCSTDDSFRIVKYLCSRDKRIRLLSLTENVGSYNARIRGVQEVKGEVCTFCDADDTMEPRALELMLQAMAEYQVDLVQMRYRRQMKGVGVKYLERWNPELANRRVDGIDFRSLASYVGMDSYIYPSCWGKLYNVALLRSVKMIEFNQFWGDDQIFNIQYLRACRSMTFIDYVGYCYYWGGSTSINYKFSLLREYKNVHSIKRVFGQSEEYIDTELIMLLRYHVRQLLTELSWTREAVVELMEEELRDPLWKQLGFTTPAAELVASECENVQKSPLKYLAKKLLK